jgi:PIN domain nuclease of toxin-antitoxin system
VTNGSPELAPGARTGIREAGAVPKLRVLPVTEQVATEAGLPGPDFHGDAADRLIVATARDPGAALVTRDQRIRASRRVETPW